MKCLITELVAEEGMRLLKENGIKVDLAYDKSREELEELISDYQVLIVRAETPVDKELIDLGKNLKAIGMAGIGLNHIDIDYAKEKGIGVFNVADGSITSVAELTLALMLASSRNIYKAVDATKNGHWDKTGFTGNLLEGKTVGILALGKIGYRVAELCQAFNMKVIAYDPYINPKIAAKANIELKELDEVLKEADIISIHSPLTRETYHMIGEKEIEEMKDGAIILNLGRGGIIDEEALYQALKSGKLKAAAADVMENEPPKEEDKKLKRLDNFTVTSHIGAGTEEAQSYISVSLAEQIIDHLKS